MSFIKALFSHVWLVMRMKHDGTGLPVNFIGAFILATIYIGLVVMHKNMSGELTIGAIIALVFIGQLYLFSLRNTVMGLVILIGIIGNVFSLVMAAFGEVSMTQMLMLSVMQYLLVFGALINVIKTHANAE